MAEGRLIGFLQYPVADTIQLVQYVLWCVCQASQAALFSAAVHPCVNVNYYIPYVLRTEDRARGGRATGDRGGRYRTDEGRHWCHTATGRQQSRSWLVNFISQQKLTS
jgi:hypothetical protein